MQSTKTATTIEKVNWEEPKARPPSRISTLWSVIIAKPVSRATAAKLAKPATCPRGSRSVGGGRRDRLGRRAQHAEPEEQGAGARG